MAGTPLSVPMKNAVLAMHRIHQRGEENSVDLERSTRARYSVAQVKDSMWEALDNLVQSGATDQMRGYANEAMGKTKLNSRTRDAVDPSHAHRTGADRRW